MIFNKSDLLDDEETQELKKIIQLYESFGVKALLVSAIEDDDLSILSTLIDGKVTLVAGHSGVGKSNILNRLVNEEFMDDCRATVGVELYTKTYKVNDRIIKVHLWDTAGQEKFRAIAKIYYKDARVALVVYDVSNR